MKLDSDRPLLLPIPTPSTGAEIPDSGRVLLDITKIMPLMGKGGGGGGADNGMSHAQSFVFGSQLSFE